MTTDQNPDRALRAVLTVTIETRPDGRYYVDCDDLLSHVIPWVEGTLEDRDVIVGVTVAEAPLSPDYEHPECGFHWHGRDGMDIPVRDGQPVCPRCELRRVEKLLAHRERRCQELREECLRRGKNVLAGSLKIVALERQLDEVRRQLGAEILRAGQAEAELRRVAAEEQPAPCAECSHPKAEHREGEDPVTPGQCGACLDDDARHDHRPAVGEQPETQEAQPSRHRWNTETLDNVANEWAPGMRFTNRAEALERYQAISAQYPLWKDGSPVRRRFVRETTSYTVEAPE